MKTIQETKEWLLENRVNENGDLDLSGLDFSDFEGNVDISGMIVNKNLFQDNQQVQGSLYQSNQNVEGNLMQTNQKVGGVLYEHYLDDEVEYWEENKEVKYTLRKNKLKKITIQELNEMGYDLKLE